jgi:hypothetical protein
MYKKIILLFVSMFLVAGCGVNIKNFEYLKEPRIINLERQKVLYIETFGDPNDNNGAIGALYQTYFKLKFKGKKMIAPKARWPKPLDTPKNEWIGIWALNVPEEINSVPMIKNSKYQVKIGYWEYGQVAEILHLGPYDKEVPAVDKLKKFVTEKGYMVMPETHEEEYIKGPGMFGKGNPEKYITIIRYTLKNK